MHVVQFIVIRGGEGVQHCNVQSVTIAICVVLGAVLSCTVQSQGTTIAEILSESRGCALTLLQSAYRHRAFKFGK